jgi:hydroxyethylthiazole kinase-like sugar kinase family protein
MSETAELLKRIKEKKPLIHHITIWVQYMIVLI